MGYFLTVPNHFSTLLIVGGAMSPLPKQSSESNRSIELQVSEIDLLASKLLDLDLELNSNIPTTLWISDLHGEGDRFKSILRGRFGMLYPNLQRGLTQHIQFRKNTISDENHQKTTIPHR